MNDHTQLSQMWISEIPATHLILRQGPFGGTISRGLVGCPHPATHTPYLLLLQSGKGGSPGGALLTPSAPSSHQHLVQVVSPSVPATVPSREPEGALDPRWGMGGKGKLALSSKHL